MKICEVRILPPLAIGRLGASSTPLEAFDLVVPKDRPLDFHTIEPRPTLVVDTASGRIRNEYTPESIVFKDATNLDATDGRIRPVAPFLEVFAITDRAPNKLVPLSTSLLREAGLKLAAVHWDVEVGNIKVFRRTADPND